MMTQEEAEKMSNEQAIQILKPLRDMMIDQNSCPVSDAVFALDKAIKALEQLQWIPCSETVDTPDHEVLCCDRYGEELIGWLSYNDDQWLCESDGEMMYDPIAWCEKPEPYTERREE